MPKEVKSLEKSIISIAVLLIVIFILALKINSLYRTASIDYLTGVYNRRFFEGYFCKMANKKNCTLACIMIDIDGFKKINDEYGHNAGDEVLKQTAELLRKSLDTTRKAGFIVRYGGDEFFMVLHTDDFAEVKKIAEQVKSFEKCLGVSYSIGYDVYDPLRWEGFKQFMHHVDTLMYKNKSYKTY
jgi:diguanylate cyclase (GGDEF)-like protein